MNFSIFLVFLYLSNIFFSCVFADERKVYIAYMGSLPEKENEYSLVAHHQKILEEILEDSSLSGSLVYNYKRSFNGFAALLTEKESHKLEGMEGIVSIFPSKTCKLYTTRSWSFMGFGENVKRVPAVESSVIVGVIDSGIWEQSESFDDEGFGDIPKKWKGSCSGGKEFKCNRKVIGARYYGASGSARDNVGHGTHTASIAAGNQVNNVSFYGLAQGNARGAVPSARIAIYKVCSAASSCEDADIMAAFDDAISDGVDMLSVSMGPMIPGKFIEDPIAIGSFHAMARGILTSQGAGNDGAVISVAPWVLTAAAGTLDRLILDNVVLSDGHNTTLQGTSINSFESTKFLPVIDELDRGYKSGKILFIDRFDFGEGALEIKASGLITCRDTLEEEGHSTLDPLPAAVLNSTYCKTLKTYINSRRNPMARILRSHVLHDSGAPTVAVFSSRGPNRICKDILKPDLTAPGSDIIAAWPPVIPPSHVKGDKRSVQYSFLSGTSMSCPHVTGAAAYIKSFHPHWTPSAIKSALMTTAFPLNSTGNQDAEFGYGAGHIDPVKAVNPGLVYDAGEEDYIKFLCSIGYTAAQLKLLTGRETSCPKDFKGSPKDLNYPSFVVDAEEAKFSRTVTNVGMAISTYKATVASPPNWNITVTPNVLSFKYLNEKQSFILTVSATALPEKQIQSASLLWSDGVHKVKSPIVLNVST